MDLEYCSIHGRFQPFHNAHLAYALAALGRSKRIYVGLTRVLTEGGIGGEVAPHRLESGSNPFSYFERAAMVRAALNGAGIADERFDIGPFPIENPERLGEFWPVNLPCLTTIVDQWNEQKVRVLRAAGYSVEIVHQGAWRGEKYASGTTIRQMIRDGDGSWCNYVPTGSVDLVRRFSAERKLASGQ